MEGVIFRLLRCDIAFNSFSNFPPTPNLRTVKFVVLVVFKPPNTSRKYYFVCGGKILLLECLFGAAKVKLSRYRFRVLWVPVSHGIFSSDNPGRFWGGRTKWPAELYICLNCLDVSSDEIVLFEVFLKFRWPEACFRTNGCNLTGLLSMIVDLKRRGQIGLSGWNCGNWKMKCFVSSLKIPSPYAAVTAETEVVMVDKLWISATPSLQTKR